MATPDLRQLPVRVELAPSESGLSFALRALRANGVPFDRGMQWLGLERHKPVDRDALRQAAWALNVDADAWGQRIVAKDPGGKGWVRLAGQRIRRHVASTRYYAKLCPQCVREHGFARLSWLLRATVGCPWHGYSLISSCSRCGQAISWDRPDIDICRCGHPFKADAKPQPLEAGVMAWLCWLESVLGQPALAELTLSAEGALPGALTHLSIDGAFRIIEASGLRVGTENVRTAAGRCSTPRELGAAIARGVERLQAIERDPGDVRHLARVINQVALIHLVGDFADPADHAMAWWLLHGLAGTTGESKTRAGIRPKGQLPLFIA
jgi:hypothetical protein